MLQHVPEGGDPVWHLYVIRCQNRDLLQSKLKDARIGTLIHYLSLPYMQEVYKNIALSQGDFPVNEKLSQQILSLPIGPQLLSEALMYVIDVLRKAL